MNPGRQLFGKGETFQSIQALRGVAAMLVVLFHSLPGKFVTGAAGVDIFFVISGFIMGAVATTDRPLVFLAKRLARIAPLYWLATLAMCAAALAGLFRSFTFDAHRLILSLLFIPHLDDHGNPWPLLVVGWTLCFELFFYVVFALGLAVRRPVALTTALLVSSVTAGLVLAPTAPTLATWSSPLLLEFLAGLLLAAGRHRLAHAGLGVALLLGGATGLALAEIMQWSDPGVRLFAWGMPAFALVAGAVMIERAGAWPSPIMGPIGALGDISYSLYLTHGFVVAFVHRMLPPTGMSVIASLMGSVGVAILCYRWLEMPIARYSKRLLRRSIGKGRAHLNV